MEERKKLKNKISQDKFGHELRIYIQDDLTKRRAYLAFLARQLKRSDRISETWVSFGKNQIKDNHGRIKAINTLENIRKFEIQWDMEFCALIAFYYGTMVWRELEGCSGGLVLIVISHNSCMYVSLSIPSCFCTLYSCLP